MTSDSTLLLRCDANVSIGTGHVMRCLALAQAWQDCGGHAMFAMAEHTPAVRERLRSENCQILRLQADPGSSEDAAKTSEAARACAAAWVVVDSYCFGSHYQWVLKEEGCRVLFVDDNGHSQHYSAELVLNQNVYADEEAYRQRDGGTELLLGPKYAMLRREFSAWQGWKREIPARARRVLVTMGGSDPDNVTALVLRVVLSQPDARATVVLGGSNPHTTELYEEAHQYGDRATVLENVLDMPALIAGADVAVSGAGTTTLEMCYLGLPALLVVLAENQRRAAEQLDARGVALNLGAIKHLDLGHTEECLARLIASHETRAVMAMRGQQLVDGRGAQRVSHRLTSLTEG